MPKHLSVATHEWEGDCVSETAQQARKFLKKCKTTNVRSGEGSIKLGMCEF
jgi:hypothetical protein